MNTIEQQRRHFDNIAIDYHNILYNETMDYLIYKMWVTLMKNISLPREQNINLLDAMCGNSGTFDMFLKLGYTNINYNAFDYSPKMVAFAKAKYPNCRIWEQDITTFCEPDTYDIICIMGGPHHVHRYAQIIITNIFKSLKPGGYFFCGEPTHNNALSNKIRDNVYLRNNMFDYETEKGFSLTEWNTLISDSNLAFEHQIYPGLLAYILLNLPFLFHRYFQCFTKIKKVKLFSEYSIRKLIDIESCIWKTSIARFFSFSTFGCYKKHITAASIAI